MKIVFVSNYYNHHQAFLSEAIYHLTNGNYYFIENEKISSERLTLGWGLDSYPEFVKQAYVSEKAKLECIQLINVADIVLYEFTTQYLVKERLENGGLTFLYSERIFKAGYEWWKLPYRIFKWRSLFRKYGNHYLLCASAYAYADYMLTLNFINKAYKWGYFPEVTKENLIELEKSKDNHKISILWVARLIEWKHPEIPIKLAETLTKKGYSFDLNMIGIGPMESQLREEIEYLNLKNCVHILGSMRPQEVRNYMRMSNIFLFTSDYNEGWGAVLNESMNSACAVVASHAIGSVPFLIENGKNGLIYKNGDEKDLLIKVEKLINDPKLRKKLGESAYKTMTEEWNADIAAKRLIDLSEDLLMQGKSSRFNEGPCSRAQILKNNWF